MLKAMILDINGVITNLSFFHYLAWKSVLSFYRVNLMKDDYLKYLSLPRKAVVRKILRDKHVHFDAELVNKIAKQKNNLFLHLIKYRLDPTFINHGIRQLIDDALERGIKLIAISTSSNAMLEIERLGLSSKFIYVTPPVNKETEEIKTFLLENALKVTGIHANECIGIEDQIEGINVYNKIGIFSVAVANYRQDIKKISNYWVDLPEQIRLEEIIFRYYGTNLDDD